MRRVLVLSDLWLPFPGGAERLMYNVARHLQREHEVSVLTGYEHAQEFDGPDVDIDLDLPIDEDGAGRMREWIRARHPDVIVTHHVWARSFEEVMADAEVPIVQFVLNGPRMNTAALAVFISEHVRTQAGNARAGDIVITPPAFGDVVAGTHAEAIGFIKPLPHKGAALFWSIARAMPDRRFVVLRGEWQDLEIVEDLPNVELMEPVADIREFWQAVDMVLMPSLSEDAGTVAQEAAANGVPCLSTGVGGLSETNGGLLLGPERVDRWVRDIRRLDEPGWRAHIVERQREWLERLDHAGKLDALSARIGAL